jgi:hypothetical protein
MDPVRIPAISLDGLSAQYLTPQIYYLLLEFQGSLAGEKNILARADIQNYYYLDRSHLLEMYIQGSPVKGYHRYYFY